MNLTPDSSPSRPKRRWFPFGTLRVRLRFSSVEVIEHRKNPTCLVGHMFAWDQIGRFGTFSRLEDEDGYPIRCQGRRWSLKIDDTRQMRIANRLRARWIKKELRTGGAVREYARPEKAVRWIMWMSGTLMAVMIVALVAPAAGGTMRWLQSQPLSMQVVAGLTLGGALLMHALMVVISYYFGWKAGLPIAQRILFDAEGFTAEISTGELRQIEWGAVRSMRREWNAYRLDVAGQNSVRLPCMGVTRTVLGEMKERTQQRDVRAETAVRPDIIRSGLSRRLLWRVTVWCFLGGVVAAAAMWWIAGQGLNPAPLTVGRYLAGVAGFAFFPTFFWLVYLFGDPWNRRSKRIGRQLRHRWRQFRTFDFT